MTDRTIDLIIGGETKDSATVDSRPGGEATATLVWDTTDDGAGQFTARVVLDDGIDEDLETVTVDSGATWHQLRADNQGTNYSPRQALATDATLQTETYVSDQLLGIITVGDTGWMTDATGNIIQVDLTTGTETTWYESGTGNFFDFTYGAGSPVYDANTEQIYMLIDRDQASDTAFGGDNLAAFDATLSPSDADSSKLLWTDRTVFDGETASQVFHVLPVPGSPDILVQGIGLADGGDGNTIVQRRDASGGVVWTNEVANTDTAKFCQLSSIYADSGRAYVATALTNGNDELRAINLSDGSTAWSIEDTISDGSDGYFYSSMAVADGTLVVACDGQDGDGAIVNGYNASDGSLAWSVSRADLNVSTFISYLSGYDASEGAVYLQEDGYAIHKLNVGDGSQAWRSPVGSGSPSPGALTVCSDALLVSDTSLFYRVDKATGAETKLLNVDYSLDADVIPIADGRVFAWAFNGFYLIE